MFCVWSISQPNLVMELFPVAQKLNDAIRQINHYPEEKHSGKQLHHPMDTDLQIYLVDGDIHLLKNLGLIQQAAHFTYIMFPPKRFYLLFQKA